jgi:hypothetical protein
MQGLFFLAAKKEVHLVRSARTRTLFPVKRNHSD